MVGRPARASPMEEYTGDLEMESRRFTSLTDACTRTCHHPLVPVWALSSKIAPGIPYAVSTGDYLLHFLQQVSKPALMI